MISFWPERVLGTCVALALAVCVTQPLWAEDRVAEPAPAQLVEAEKLVREVYKDDYAKRGIDERRALAQKLLEEGKANKSDAPSQYVLLREAREAAIAVGDVETAMAAVHEMGQVFLINAVEMKIAALQSMKLVVHTVDGQQAAAEASMEIVNEALAAENFDAANRSADLAIVFATGAKNIGLATDAQARKAEIKSQSTAYLGFKIADERLKKDPKDAASNYAMGSYLALYKNNWDGGLAKLALGNDVAFAETAKADLASPVDVIQMIKVADAWFDLAAAHPTIKVRLLARAEFWYNLVGPNTEGLVKQKVDKRLEQIAAAKEGTGAAPFSTVADSTRRVLPTAAEMKKLKDLSTEMRTNPARQNEYTQHVQFLQNRLQIYFQQNFQGFQQNGTPLKEGDFFACCKADSDIRKITMVTPSNFYMNNNLNLIGNFQNFADQSKSKEEFTARLLAYEKFNATEKVLDPINLDSVVYSTLRAYVTRNQATYPTAAARNAFCLYLKQKGVRSGGLERYRTFVNKFRIP